MKFDANQIANSNASIKPIAVILTAEHDGDGVYLKDKGYFNANVRSLIQNGYKVIEIDNVSDPKEVGEILDSIEPGKINFMCPFKPME
jgi:hypothetical protein